ncbi:thioesterase II family protein [Amycolatopsis samaneae]|uniref:Thioesterase II family protein n=1 Tax=Amycolatopsis samaneae TaxID=664691 RepID=A0ABW5GW62_9PSEU
MSAWLPAASPVEGMRLFCFPHAGAGASAYRAWTGPLARSGIAVCPVQLPGRENRMGEPAFRAVEPLVDALVMGLADRLVPPFALFGHSMGALVAFELAHALRERGAPLPAQLFVSGRIAPQLTDPRGKLHDLSDAELGARLAELDGMPAALLADPEVLAFLLPLLRADLAVNEDYRYSPRPPLPMPITAFGGTGDPKVTEAELRAWAEQTDAAFAAHSLPGGHFFVQESMRSLLGFLAVELSRTLAAPRVPGQGAR